MSFPQARAISISELARPYRPILCPCEQVGHAFMNRLPEMVARKAKLAQTGGASQRLHNHTRGLPSLTVHPETYPVSIDTVPYFA